MVPGGIVYASFDRFPAPKGAAVHIRAFVEALGGAFGRVDLLALRDGSTAGPAGDALGEGITFHPLEARGPDLVAQALDFRAQLAAWWRGRARADVVHVRSIFEGYPLARHKERLTRHLVYEVNGLPSIELKYHHPGVAEDVELLRKLRAQEYYCLKRADLVVTPSAVTAEHLVGRGVEQERLRVIPNGVDPALFSWQPPRPWGERPVRLLYSGTMTAWQGVHHAIAACRLLRREFPTTLTLVGPLRRNTRRELLEACGELVAEGAVEVLDALPQAELARLHHACDVALVPLPVNDRNTVQGCCPLKLVEAMAAGTPVIASDLPVVRALAEPGEHALLVRPGSALAIADAVRALRTDARLGPQLSTRARARVERDFTWARAQEALVAAYEETLGMARASTRERTSASARA